jgi:hypothetical protein
MAMQKLYNAAKQLSYRFLSIVLFIVCALVVIIVAPVIFISYLCTQLKIRTRTLRKKLKEKL